MKKLIIISSLLISTLAWSSCADLSKKPKFMGHAAIKCGKLIHSIEQPTITVNGKTVPYATVLGDMWGKCADNDRGCFRPWYNIVARGNVICHAYGFGDYAKSNGYSPLFHTEPQVMGALIRDAKGVLHPTIVKVNPKRSEYSWVKNIWCYPNYSKR